MINLLTKFCIGANIYSGIRFFYYKDHIYNSDGTKLLLGYKTMYFITGVASSIPFFFKNIIDDLNTFDAYLEKIDYKEDNINPFYFKTFKKDFSSKKDFKLNYYKI